MQSFVISVVTKLIMDKHLISIVGPTGIGKTNLSLKLASYFDTEIISADSRQFYKEIPIGTAAPTTSELSLVKHYFIHHKSIKDPYNVGTFEKEAIEQIRQCHLLNPMVIMVGGSGLYVNAILEGLDEFPIVNSEIRDVLNLELATSGIEILQKELKELDPKSYDSIELKNPQRLIRALEICRGTEKPYSSFLKKNHTQRNFKTISIGLKADRSLIYERINNRVDQMIKNGLLEEAKSVFKYKNLNALNTVGYKELFNYFEEQWTLDFAISEIKKNTRRFAKRQLTWFQKDKNAKWFEYDTDPKKIISYLNTELKKTS
mgnify:CR=1 FL=1